MEPLLIDAFKTTFDNEGKGHVIITLDGKSEDIGTIGICSHLSADEVNARAKEYLKINDLALKPIAPKVKRPYHKKVNLTFADDFGKVTLKIANAPHETIVYYLYTKDGHVVYKLDAKGIYVSKGTKTKPLAFTSNDIKRIRNTDDFIIKKATIVAKHKVKDKISA